ncbi:hypothetical protein WJX73_008476 [Symbiochloris irregularis]|uniref:Uncharacterized protein n=1 Tax=Symbiochloris irregularis TaxID=706552 RepID=A0AAW1NRV8_9CHLO
MSASTGPPSDYTGPSKPPARLNSLHENFNDPSFLSQDEPGFQRSSTRSTPAAPGPMSTFSLSGLFGGLGAKGSGAGPSLHAIKTNHMEPISHPELAFSPTEIGVWEIHKEKMSGDAKEPGRGFFR